MRSLRNQPVSRVDKTFTQSLSCSGTAAFSCFHTAADYFLKFSQHVGGVLSFNFTGKKRWTDKVDSTGAPVPQGLDQSLLLDTHGKCWIIENWFQYIHMHKCDAYKLWSWSKYKIFWMNVVNFQCVISSWLGMAMRQYFLMPIGAYWQYLRIYSWILAFPASTWPSLAMML